jgi:hypothetical protein
MIAITNNYSNTAIVTRASPVSPTSSATFTNYTNKLCVLHSFTILNAKAKFEQQHRDPVQIPTLRHQPFTMARRTSSRAASHDQASSPPKPDASKRTVRSPQKRSTRATRSQSRDLDEPYAPALRQAAGRNERQGSVDSVGSDASAANNGHGKKVRGNAPIQPGKIIRAKAQGCVVLTYNQTCRW